MSQSEVDQFLKVLETYKEKIVDDKKKSTQFLIDIGLLTKQGKIKKVNEDICTPQEQD